MKLIACNEIPRTKLYTYLGMAKTQLRLSDEEYRDLLKLHGAVADNNDYYSAKSLTGSGLEAVLHDLQRMGFSLRTSSKNKTAKWREPRINKLNAMWCALHDSGVVENRSEQAMAQWCENHVPNLTHLRWATSDQLNKAVEMLKQFAIRAEVKVY